MTKDDILRMAKPLSYGWWLDDEKLETFAKLLVANLDPKSFMTYQEGYEAGVVAEREECAKVCEAQGEYGDEQYAKAIRARGTT